MPAVTKSTCKSWSTMLLLLVSHIINTVLTKIVYHPYPRLEDKPVTRMKRLDSLFHMLPLALVNKSEVESAALYQ